MELVENRFETDEQYHLCNNQFKNDIRMFLQQKVNHLLKLEELKYHSDAAMQVLNETNARNIGMYVYVYVYEKFCSFFFYFFTFFFSRKIIPTLLC